MVITNRCKLDLKLGFMVVRSEDTKRILLDEISVIVIENTGVAITGCLLNELSRRKVKVIFCDKKAQPRVRAGSALRCARQRSKGSCAD